MVQPGAIEAQPEGIAQRVAAKQQQFGAVAAGYFAALHQNAQVAQARIPPLAEFLPHRSRR
jgi:hypothetical protein